VAELPIGTGKTAETVRMVRQPPRTMACPGDPACPVWPQARARGAGPSNVDPSPAYGAGHFRDPLRRGLAAITSGPSARPDTCDPQKVYGCDVGCVAS